MIKIEIPITKDRFFFKVDFDSNFKDTIQFIKGSFIGREYLPASKKWSIPYLKANLRKIYAYSSNFSNLEILKNIESIESTTYFMAKEQDNEIKMEFTPIGPDNSSSYLKWKKIIDTIKDWVNFPEDRGFSPNDKAWFVSKHTWALLKLELIDVLVEFGENFEFPLSDDINELLQDKEKVKKESLYRPNINDENFNRLVNEIKTAYPFLRDYQAIDTATYCVSPKILNANQMGLGKTIETGAYISFRNPAKVLIVVPNPLKRQWNRELKKFFNLDSIVIEGGKRKRHKLWNAVLRKRFIIITNYENLRTDDFYEFILDHKQFDLIVFDEITRCKHSDTKTFKRCNLLKGKRIVGLTGTPIENKLIDIYNIMRIIHPTFFGSWKSFLSKYLIKKKVYFKYKDKSGQVKTRQLTRYVERLNSAESVAEELKEFNGWIRWNRKSVLSELPDVLTNEYAIKLTKEEKIIYDKIKGEAAIMFDKQGHKVNLKEILSKILAMRRFCSDPSIYFKMEFGKEVKTAKKLEFLKVVQEYQDTNKILVFSEWKDVIFSYANALTKSKIKCLTLTGDDSPDQKDEKLHQFEFDESYRVLLCTESLSYGANLQFCSILINIDLHFNPARFKQRIGRIQRIGQKEKQINVITFLIEDSIEDFVYSKILDKQNLFDVVVTSSEKKLDMIKEFFEFDKERNEKAIQFSKEQLILSKHSEKENDIDVFDSSFWE